jgi:hypothetical protein
MSKILFKEQAPAVLSIISPVLSPQPILQEVVSVEIQPSQPPALVPAIAHMDDFLRTSVTPTPENNNIYRDKELDSIRRTLTDIMRKVSTLSWGGGGTGIVRLWDADDFDRASRIDDRQFVTFRDGWFQMDYINPDSLVANTVYITSNTYQITVDDYYIGVNANSIVTVTLPPASEVYTGREFYVKDESGQAGYPYRYIDVYPTAPDKIDNEDYVRLNINDGGLKFIYRDGWRVL